MRPAQLCSYCAETCIRKGTYQGIQLLRCGTCKRYQRSIYKYKARTPGADQRIILYVREGCGIRSISRIRGIAVSTVIARIKRIARGLGTGYIPKSRRYEVDELSTYIGNKMNRIWVAYALDRKCKAVSAIRVGKRSKRTLQPLINTLVLADAKLIQTDTLIPWRQWFSGPTGSMLSSEALSGYLVGLGSHGS